MCSWQVACGVRLLRRSIAPVARALALTLLPSGAAPLLHRSGPLPPLELRGRPAGRRAEAVLLVGFPSAGEGCHSAGIMLHASTPNYNPEQRYFELPPTLTLTLSLAMALMAALAVI